MVNYKFPLELRGVEEFENNGLDQSKPIFLKISLKRLIAPRRDPVPNFVHS